MKIFERLISIWVLALLTACGGSGDAGTPIFGGENGGGTTTPTASDLVLALSSSTIANSGLQTIVATATTLDANRNTIGDVPVTIAVDNGATSTPSGAVTDSTGAVTATIGIGSDRSNRVITVTATSGSLTRTAILTVADTGGTAGSSTLAVSLSGTTVTPTAPVTVTVTLTDSSGNPVRQSVVNLSTQRGNLATLSEDSVLTDATGTATIMLSTAASGVAGADDVVASATVGATQVQGRAGFRVSASTATISLSPSSASLRTSTAPATFEATVRNAAGNLVANQLVQFSSSGGLLSQNAASALTNAQGVASVKVSPLSPTNAGVAIVTAEATVEGRDVLADASVTLTPEAPALVPTVTNSTVSSAAPVTLRVVLRDLAGKLQPNAVVSFSSQFNLASFSPVTATTNDAGEATTVISPRLATSNGADTITASATVQGQQASAVSVLQFVGTTPTGTPKLDLSLSRTSISAATPADVTVLLRDAQGSAVAGQVVTFGVARALATTNVTTALTNQNGEAVVVLSPASSVAAGADEVTATVTFAGATLQRSAGFQVQATPVTLDAFTSAASPLSAYGQTTLTLALNGASVTSPVNISVSSSCVSQNKATLSPSTFTATSNSVSLQYRDNGCGAVQNADQLLAVVTSTGTSKALSLPIQSPAESSIAFVQAAPEQIFLKGSGFTESSVVTFEVRDAAGNPLPGRTVELRLQTGAGGVTMEGRGVESVDPPSPNPFTLTSNALGRVSARVNSGTLPTPVRVNARLQGTSIATVSSNLSVAIGLPSQLNFSLSQGTKNIEGYNIDGTPNTYQIIAADRSGNPVPEGTSINFVTEGGQVEAIKQTQLVGGIARTTANFVSSEPRPVDGRVTITVYALGEESFLDVDGNNVRGAGEPFQDLGNIFKDRNFDGIYDVAVDEFVPLVVNNSAACTPPANNLLRLDASIPSMPGTCDGDWSGAGQVYVRRATETVLSTSGARPLWASTRGLTNACSKITMQVGPDPTQTATFTQVAGDTWYGGTGDTLTFIVGDANPGSPIQGLLPRLNPMAAGSTISVSTPTTGLTVQLGGGSPLPSTTEASLAAVAYSFTDGGVNEGLIFVTFVSPSGTGTTVSVPVVRGTPRPSECPP